MRLRPLPESFSGTRDALHHIAFFVLGPWRYRAEGRMGLQAAPGGFGTPVVGGRVARVDGATLVLEESDQIASQTITTVRAAAEFFGIVYDVNWFEGFHDPLEPADPDMELDVDDTAGRALGQWFDYGSRVLDELRGHGTDEDDVSQVQLWPEHFDPAADVGSEGRGERASYGASPGDRDHPEPYLYVASWGQVDRSKPYWNDSSFNGSSLGYSELASAADSTGAGLDFLLEGYRILHGS